MKNLLIYTNPKGEFSEENKTLMKIQIDNSLDLGWKREDILIYTNFDYEYNGVKSRIVPYLHYEFDVTANKIPVIVYLIENGILEDGELYWYHDVDSYENDRIIEAELELDLVLGLCTYGYKAQWQLGGFFFRTGALDIFKTLDYRITRGRYRGRTDEKCFTSLVKCDMVDRKRFKELNVTYNLTMRYLHDNYNRATKPLKVLHFHPAHVDSLLPDTVLNMFMYGKNRMGVPMMSDRLIKIFNNHNIK